MAGQIINHKIVFWMFMFAIYLFEAEGELKIISLEDICINGRRFFLHLSFEEAGILQSEPKGNPISFNCEIELQPDTTNRTIVLSIRKYDVQSLYSQLTIEDSSGYKIALLESGDFKDERKSIISDGRIIIHYRRDKLVSPIIITEPPVNETVVSNREGFQFTFTQVRNAPCRDNEFPCKNGKCVLKKYFCDGHNHCGDNSDQRNCDILKSPFMTTQPKSNVFWISMVVAAGVVLIVLMVVYMILLVRYPKRKVVDSSSNGSPPSDGVNNVPIQLVPRTVQTNETEPSANANSATSIPASNEPFNVSLYDRVSSCLRAPMRKKVDEPIEQQVGSYQVPAMYPDLDEPTPHERQEN